MGVVRSVTQSFAVMRLLAGSSPLSLSAIGRALGLSPSSAFNLLKTLEREGAVERDGGTKAYRIAPAWAAIEALGKPRAQAVIADARPRVARLAQEADAAVALWRIIPRDRLQLVVRAESDAGMRIGIADGQRQPLGGGAAGRAMAAAQRIDRAELARRYSAVHWQIDLSFDAYAQQVELAARKGFAVDDGFAHRGICSVGVAIADIGPGFCLSASVFAGSRTAEEIDALGAKLIALRTALTG